MTRIQHTIEANRDSEMVPEAAVFKHCFRFALKLYEWYMYTVFWYSWLLYRRFARVENENGSSPMHRTDICHFKKQEINI